MDESSRDMQRLVIKDMNKAYQQAGGITVVGKAHKREQT